MMGGWGRMAEPEGETRRGKRREGTPWALPPLAGGHNPGFFSSRLLLLHVAWGLHWQCEVFV